MFYYINWSLYFGTLLQKPERLYTLNFYKQLKFRIENLNSIHGVNKRTANRIEQISNVNKMSASSAIGCDIRKQCCSLEIVFALFFFVK